LLFEAWMKSVGPMPGTKAGGTATKKVATSIWKLHGVSDLVAPCWGSTPQGAAAHGASVHLPPGKKVPTSGSAVSQARPSGSWNQTSIFRYWYRWQWCTPVIPVALQAQMGGSPMSPRWKWEILSKN
jgi:hypothetical protein